MKGRTMIIIGSLAALLLGLAVAYPLLVSNLPSLSKADFGVDVAYVYIAPLKSDSNLTGLYWNNSVVEIQHNGGLPSGALEADGLVVSYFVVLNITNYSDDSARIKNFDIMIGPQISGGSGGVIAENPVLSDSRHLTYYPEWDEVWSPHSSRLIGLSGVTGVHEIPYASLNSSLVYLYGSAEGQVAYTNGGQSAVSYSLKQVQLQTVGNGYLYNTLINENQILLFYEGLDVSIGTRR
jgi:hypothetical protein